MPQFPVTPEREKILRKIPDYAVNIEAAGLNVIVSFDETVIAETGQALLVRETRHADVFYLPRADIDMSLLAATDHATFCPFKGYASYWTARIGDQQLDNVAWSYEEPYQEVEGLKDYISFYTDRVRVRTEPLR